MRRPCVLIGELKMKSKSEYTPLDGFENLRDYEIPKKEFAAFMRVQDFLYSWEQKRRAGAIVPDKVREVSAIYQNCLSQYGG